MSAAPQPPTPDFRLRSRRVFTRQGERPATLHVRNGRIAAIEDYDSRDVDDAGDAEDLGDVAILPGIVDVHVHLNEPGRTEWEGFATGTAAAAAGGTTLVVDMPLNSSPVTTTAAALAAKRAATSGKLSCDVGFYGGLVPGNEGEIAALVDAGVLGIKVFLCHSGIDDFPAATERELRAAMPVLAVRGLPLLAHAELVTPQPPQVDPRSFAQFLASRPPEFERAAIRLLIDLCRETRCRTHIVHLADAESLPLLAAARAEGLPLTVETCPHYLLFDAESISDGATEFKCTPPIRPRANREQLWQGLYDEVIDFIATDHSPSPPEMKRREDGNFAAAWGGISSVQLLLSAVWTEASQRGHTLAEVIEWLSHRPAQFVGRSTAIAPGAEANFVAFDPEAAYVVRGQELKHRHPLTPYEGRELRGIVQQTWLRGVPAAPGVGMTI
ncbi:MAG: allantoinase AllB [Pirellulales bacterium]